ncbi:serine/threonine-protein kinase [Nannocystis bainbridge]|uniref:Serine/threonine-protein kinase n=1 Tax=Nannocystis bainbridge TaxID=2995303 RepID=A0ABT5E7G5_9BACT|nr:serine/threonine-protein kinase [Nannocystis bainbridge]MDC0721605.1 serine/threonine-protein kinase [Nannocystis bainbridge]
MPATARPQAPASHVVRAAQARLVAHLGEADLGASAEPTLTPAGSPTRLADPTSWPGPSRAPHQPADDERYEFGEAFAAGGLGVVRRARDRRLGRDVAVKELMRTDPAAEHRFALEAAITARLQHPGIVPLYDIGRHATGEPYYCMKLVEGQTLEHEIRRRSQPYERLALIEHVIAAADAVAYAHRHGVLHRDLKPANILVGELGEAVVIDWGLAKDTTQPSADPPPSPHAPTSGFISTVTEHGTVLGTLRYMPPEQARGEVVDARGDVFALGAVLYHVLAGAPPYADVDGRVLASRVVEAAVDDLRERAPEAPRELVAIAQRAMAARPEDRYASAEALAEDLRRFLTGRMVDAHRYSAGEVVRLWLRRHRAAVGVASASLVALVAGGAYAVQNVYHQRDAAAVAQAHAEAARGEAESALATARQQTTASLLAQARAALNGDLAGSLTALAQVDLSDETSARRARLLALAAETRGAPTRILHGHARPVSQVVALSDGALVSVDVGGDVWKWDAKTGAGARLFELGEREVVLVVARDAPIFAAIGRRSARVERAGHSQAIDVSMVDRGDHGIQQYRWTMSAGGEALAALSEPATSSAGFAGAPAYRWDLTQEPAKLDVVPGTRGRTAALSPDGRTVAYEDAARGAFLRTGEQSLATPAISGPLEFSSSGAHLVSWAVDQPPRHVAYTPATQEVHPLGRWTLAIAPDDRALVLDVDDFTGMISLSMRSLADAATRWTATPVESGNLVEWGDAQEYDVVVDPRGDSLAVRTPDHWLLGSQTDGSFPRRLDADNARHAAYAGDGRFAVAHLGDIHVWEPAPVPPAAQGLAGLNVGALALDGRQAIVYADQGSPRLRDMFSGTSTASCHDRLTVEQFLDPEARSAVGGGRSLFVDKAGEACLGDGAGLHEFAVGKPTTSVALADAGSAFAAGFADGTVLTWRDVAATARKWELGAQVAGLVLTRAGDGAIAFTPAGQVFALTDAADGPRQIAAIDPGPPTTYYRPPQTIVHPRAAIAVVPLIGHDAIAVHDFASGATTRRPVVLPAVPTAAYSPSGETLAVAVAGRRVLLVRGADDPGRELALPDDARALAFVGEDQLAVLGESGDLLRLDTVLGEAAVVRRAWTARLDGYAALTRANLVADPDGATVAFTQADFDLTVQPADPLPREPAALAGWLQTRARQLAGG